MERIVIVGGGIAGLSCLNALLDLDMNALLLEGTTIGLPKICGEFIAPRPSHQLQQWHIGPLHTVSHAYFNSAKTTVKIHFNNPAGAMSRSSAEIGLAHRAKQLGARIREQARIKQILPKTSTQKYFKILLETGEEIITHSIVIALGRLQKDAQQTPMRYNAVKLHFARVVELHSLHMFSLRQAYLGIVPISDNECNCAFLSLYNNQSTPPAIETLFTNLVAQQPYLQKLFKNIDFSSLEISHTLVPTFGIKKTPDWQDAYFIGDALVSFPPAVGSGFAHSIESGVHAARFYQKADYIGFDQVIKQEIRHKLWLGKLMHTTLLHPTLSSSLFHCLNFIPGLTRFGLRRLKFL